MAQERAVPMTARTKDERKVEALPALTPSVLEAFAREYGIEPASR